MRPDPVNGAGVQQDDADVSGDELGQRDRTDEPTVRAERK
jgi:hypothetical protein